MISTRGVLVAGVMAIAGLVSVGPAAAELQFSVYGGLQGANDSDVTGNDPAGVGAFGFTQRWEGKSFDSSPYWGARATWWLNQKPNWGVSLEYTHAKVYADPLQPGWQQLEFSDGLNIFTLNGLYRFKDDSRAWTPYIGAGIGLSVPHVEVQTTAVSPLTFEYQFGGIALGAQAGLEYRFSRYFSAFTEYKFNYTQNQGDLVGGGTIDADVITHALNFGVSFHWE